MKHIVEKMDDLYYAKAPFGEVILDTVIDLIKKTNTHKTSDIALLMDVPDRDLRGAFSILTGMTLRDVLLEWRFRQANELILAGEMTKEQIARKCGWWTAASMNNAFENRCGRSIHEIYKLGRKYASAK